VELVNYVLVKKEVVPPDVLKEHASVLIQNVTIKINPLKPAVVLIENIINKYKVYHIYIYYVE